MCKNKIYQFFIVLISLVFLGVSCSNSNNNITTNSKVPIIMGVSPTGIGGSVAKSINIPIQNFQGEDFLILAQIDTPVITGWETIEGDTLIEGQQFNYNILSDGQNFSIKVTVIVHIDSETGAISYNGTFDKDIQDGETYYTSSDSPSNFVITLNSDKSFSYRQDFFIDEEIALNNHVFWTVHGEGEGKQTSNGFKGNGQGTIHREGDGTHFTVEDRNHQYSFVYRPEQSYYGVFITVTGETSDEIYLFNKGSGWEQHCPIEEGDKNIFDDIYNLD